MKTVRDPEERVGRLFEEHAARLCAYARRHADAQEAEDLVSEAFVVAMRRADDLPEDAEVFAWLVATVRRLAANHRRRRATRDRHWRDAVRDGWHHPTTASPEDAIAERDACLAALAALSETDRELLLLTAWEGLTPRQAAQVLGLRPNTLSARLSRARRRMQAGLNPSTASVLQLAPAEELNR